MSETAPTAASDRPAKRPRAWWQWVIGGGLLAVAAGSIILRAFPDLQWRLLGTIPEIRQIEIKPAADLKKSDVLPAEPGALAGCNVLLVTMDTTRADRLGCYGNTLVHTPTLDEFAREGVIFSNMTSAAPVTLPSHSSILTGLYPYHHGARANNLFKLDVKNTTLAEVLRDAGYKTAAFISAFVINGRFGTSQGFDIFNDQLEGDQNELWLEVAERPGNKTADLAIDWMGKHSDKPFFAWVHFYDPHSPYRAPEEYKKGVPLGYDAEISFMDAQFRRLLTELDKLGIADRTLVVVVGDHGEGLNHHGEGSHGMLVYDTVMRVPLLMKCGDRLGGGVHVTEPTSQVDIMPTVLSLLGVDAPPNMDGHDLTQPTSPDRPIFFETLEGLTEHGCAALLGVREGQYKYIFGLEPELYDVKADPFEKHDLASAKPDVVKRMHEKLKSFFGDDLEAATTPRETESLTPEELAMVNALGYAGAATGSITPASQREDPRQALEVLRKVTTAVDKGLEQGLPEFEKLATEYPDSFLVHLYRAQGYQKAGKLDQAEAAFERAAELRPGVPQPWIGLAQVNARQGDMVRAAELYEFTLTLSPGSYTVLNEYSQVLAGLGRFTDAAARLEEVFKANPTDEEIPDRLWRLKNRAGQHDDVVALFQALLEGNPDLAMVRILLAGDLLNKKDYAGCINLLREGVKLDPEKPELINNLAYALATCPDEQYQRRYEAVNMMEALCQKTDYQDPRFLNTLGMVYFMQERAEEAVRVAERAEEIASTTDDPKLKAFLPLIQKTLKGFRKAQASGLAPLLPPPNMMNPTTAPVDADDSESTSP